MHSNADTKDAAGLHMDRRIIRVESLPDQAGIAAALRRAFTAGSQDQDESNRMFEDLLSRLH
jgi:hypothetical protein